MAVELGGVVEDVELVHLALQADSSQLEIHREVWEQADWTQLVLTVVFQQQTCRHQCSNGSPTLPSYVDEVLREVFI